VRAPGSRMIPALGLGRRATQERGTGRRSPFLTPRDLRSLTRSVFFGGERSVHSDPEENRLSFLMFPDRLLIDNSPVGSVILFSA